MVYIWYKFSIQDFCTAIPHYATICKVARKAKDKGRGVTPTSTPSARSLAA